MCDCNDSAGRVVRVKQLHKNQSGRESVRQAATLCVRMVGGDDMMS